MLETIQGRVRRRHFLKNRNRKGERKWRKDSGKRERGGRGEGGGGGEREGERGRERGREREGGKREIDRTSPGLYSRCPCPQTHNILLLGKMNKQL